MNFIYYTTEAPVKAERKDSTDLSTGWSQQNIDDKIIHTGQVIERSCGAKANNIHCSIQMCQIIRKLQADLRDYMLRMEKAKRLCATLFYHVPPSLQLQLNWEVSSAAAIGSK